MKKYRTRGIYDACHHYKVAAIFGAAVPDLDLDSIPYEHRREDYADYLKAKSEEPKTPYWKAVGGGALAGGAIPALITRIAGGNAAHSFAAGGIGALLGALSGGVLAAEDHNAVDRARKVTNSDSRETDRALRHLISQNRHLKDTTQYLDKERRHSDLLYALHDIRRNQ